MYDGGISGLIHDEKTMTILLVTFLCLWALQTLSTKKPYQFPFVLMVCALLMDLPYEQSLLKRSQVLHPLLQSVLGRTEL